MSINMTLPMCGLVRDSGCVNEAKGFGKMQSLAHEFKPGLVDFAIFYLLKKLLMKQSICFIKKSKRWYNEWHGLHTADSK